MKSILRRTLKITEKTVIIVFILLSLGAIGEIGADFTIQFIRMVLLYGIVIGGLIGFSLIIFDIERWNIKVKLITHFTLSFIIMNVAEGLVFQNKFLPTSDPVAILLKFLILLVSYVVVALLNIKSEKVVAEKLNEKLRILKQDN